MLSSIYTGLFLGFALFTSLIWATNTARQINLANFIWIFLITLFLFLIINKSIVWYQIVYKFYTIDFFFISYIIGIDGISIFLILLSVFILLSCLLLYYYISYLYRYYFLILMSSLIILINVFSLLDIFLFFIFFECILIPMFFLIAIWGSRQRKIYAAYQFTCYTMFGSIFILLAIINIYTINGSSAFDFIIHNYYLPNRQLFLVIMLFLGFGVKIPIVPLHIWLPEAHVEAPTPGSIILASLLLKLGSYAMIRLLLDLIYNISIDVIFIILLISLFGFLFSSIIAINQIDIKKIIAYSSVAHMNFSLLGFFSESLNGLIGLFFLMFGHAITSGALFMCIGILYDRYKTRIIFYYSGLVNFMPIFTLYFGILILSNGALPGTINFVAEFLILVGIISYSNIILFIASFGMILTLIYSLSLYSKLVFGVIQNTFIRYYCDCTRIEHHNLIIYIIFVLYYGIFPLSLVTYIIFFENFF